MYVLVVGTAFDGLEIYGPFSDEDEAIECAEIYRVGTWSVVPVHSAETLSGVNA